MGAVLMNLFIHHPDEETLHSLRLSGTRIPTSSQEAPPLSIRRTREPIVQQLLNQSNLRNIP
jgi:hypothetical protein